MKPTNTTKQQTKQKSSTSTTTTATQPQAHYIKIQNRIIHDSFTKNNFILPVYLYSYTHRDLNHGASVDTSVANIMAYFKNGSVVGAGARGVERQVFKALNYLGVFREKMRDKEIERDAENGSDNEQNITAVGTSDKSNAKDANTNANAKDIDSFLDLLSPKAIKEFYIEYRFDERKYIKDVDTQYTLIKIDDYYSIIDSGKYGAKIHKIDGADDGNTATQAKPATQEPTLNPAQLNCVDMINYFCFLKMKIGLEYAERCKQKYGLIKSGAVKKDDLKYSKQSILGISKYISKSTRTVSKTVGDLQKIGLIELDTQGSASKIWAR